MLTSRAYFSVCRACLRSMGQMRTTSTRPSLTSARQNTGRTTTCTSWNLSSRPYVTAVAAPDEVRSPQPPSQTRMKRIPEGSPHFQEAHLVIARTEILFKECARQADYYVPQAFAKGMETPTTADGEQIGEGTGWWYESLGLIPTFASWSQITFLHLYLLTVRLRYLPPAHSKIWQQHLHDHFFWEAEHRMTIFHQITSKSIRQRYLKELYEQWRGVQGAYDEGLIKGDAVLGAAVWRNIFKADENLDWTKIALVISFMRRGLRALDKADDPVLLEAKVKFGNPLSEASLVELESEGINQRMTKEDSDGVTKFLKELGK